MDPTHNSVFRSNCPSSPEELWAFGLSTELRISMCTLNTVCIARTLSYVERRLDNVPFVLGPLTLKPEETGYSPSLGADGTSSMGFSWTIRGLLARVQHRNSAAELRSAVERTTGLAAVVLKLADQFVALMASVGTHGTRRSHEVLFMPWSNALPSGM
ncbi:hypothetical protein FA15DRAFT_697407 [Coprinopsis marcescibilis]|uniref:Uncharacterized protein n=1 Tax=Coprinopsis marcescibilis TaxID=230819 RepID=A0A5C3KID1_COPMA|nr:hypothetical protein FA15DRAFT_697407 [Coprinopsis marcescibilis]